jgi:hypothetical protein
MPSHDAMAVRLGKKKKIKKETDFQAMQMAMVAWRLYVSSDVMACMESTSFY